MKWIAGSDLADHGAAVVNELGQHHGYVVVDGGGVVRPLGRVPHKRPQSEDSCTPHLRRHEHYEGRGASSADAVCHYDPLLSPPASLGV